MPSSYSPRETYPVIIGLHGAAPGITGEADADFLDQISGLTTQADEEGYIVAFPYGEDGWTGVVQQILRRSFDVLNSTYQTAPKTTPVGLYLEVQNESVQRSRRDLVWRECGANIVYIGRNRGAQARVWYFDGAKMRR